MKPTTKFGLLSALYFSQGLPYGFFSKALPVLLREQGVSLEGIGLTSLLFWPWALKFLWAPTVDHRYSARVGRRRSWLIPLQLCNVASLLVLATWQPNSDLTPLLAVVMIVNLVSATHDIAADGLAVELLSPPERGLGNSIQVGAYRIGMIIGGGVLLMLQEYLGWLLTFGAMSGLLLLATLPILRFKEDTPPRVGPSRRVRGSLRAFARSPTGRRAIAIIIAYRLGDALTSGMIKPFMVDAGLNLADIGLMLGVVGSIMGLSGAVLGGVLMRSMSRRRALSLFIVLQALGFVAYTLAALTRCTDWTTLLVLSGLEHLASGMATVGLFTCMMDWCRDAHAATDYTLQASVVVGVMGVGSVLGGLLAGRLGYSTLFVIGTLLCFAAWPLLRLQRPWPEQPTPSASQ